jgi:hypothetical protein
LGFVCRLHRALSRNSPNQTLRYTNTTPHAACCHSDVYAASFLLQAQIEPNAARLKNPHENAKFINYQFKNLKTNLYDRHVGIVEVAGSSSFFLDQMQLPKNQTGTVQEQGLPCFMISDHRELLIAFHENDNVSEDSDKKKIQNRSHMDKLQCLHRNPPDALHQTSRKQRREPGTG